jgi:hypothetical protein
MKKLSLAAVLIMLFASLAIAHEGSLGLFTDGTATDCDLVPVIFVGFDVYMLYFRSDLGPDGITGFEFKIEKNNPNIIISGATWPMGFITDGGGVETGISVVTPGCYGAGLSYIPLGTIQMFSAVETLPDDVYIKVVADPGALEPGIWVSTCAPGRPLHEVLGGYFRFWDGACDKAVEPKSWGAIKAILDE